jgi:hypothetical protein
MPAQSALALQPRLSHQRGWRQAAQPAIDAVSQHVRGHVRAGLTTARKNRVKKSFGSKALQGDSNRVQYVAAIVK